MTVPLRVALTGGIASGKSHCLHRFEQLGASVIDADVVAREVVAPGTAGLAAVVDRFGSGVLDQRGALNRRTLARVVFADAAARRDLEAIVHPRVYARIEDWFRALSSPVGIADVPLLFETGRDSEFDRVIVAACPRAVQRERLLGRGLTAAEVDQRLAAQLPIEDKARRADHVIDTSGSIADTDRQVREIWAALRSATHVDT